MSLIPGFPAIPQVSQAVKDAYGVLQNAGNFVNPIATQFGSAMSEINSLVPSGLSGVPSLATISNMGASLGQFQAHAQRFLNNPSNAITALQISDSVTRAALQFGNTSALADPVAHFKSTLGSITGGLDGAISSAVSTITSRKSEIEAALPALESIMSAARTAGEEAATLAGFTDFNLPEAQAIIQPLLAAGRAEAETQLNTLVPNLSAVTSAASNIAGQISSQISSEVGSFFTQITGSDGFSIGPGILGQLQAATSAASLPSLKQMSNVVAGIEKITTSTAMTTIRTAIEVG